MMNFNLKNNWRKVVGLSACFVFALSVSVSCKKTFDTIGNGTLTPEELLASGGIDTFSINTYSTLQDSAYTSGVSNLVLGSMHDPKMGITNASFYAQFDYTGTLNQGNGGAPVLDSVVLSMKYVEFYGKLDEITVQVHELTEEMDVDSNYYRSTTFPENSNDLADPTSATQTPDPTKDVVIDGDTLDPQLRVKLDNTWGSTILNEGFNGTAFDSHESFRSFFNGLRVSVQETNPASGQGGILYLDPNDKNTKITFYYHITGESDPYNFGIGITSDCAYFNHVDIDNSGYPAGNIIGNPALGLNQYYAQAFNMKAIIEFAGVSDIPKNSVIHAALLELPIEYQTYNTYYPSPSLAVVFELASGFKAGSIQYNNSRKSYLFDIRLYIQEIVNDEVANTGVTVAPSKFSSSAERIIFNGPGTSNKMKPKLIIKYTTF
jgi:hypothetical protein